MSIVAAERPVPDLKTRIESHLMTQTGSNTRRLLNDILAYLETPYDISWLKDEYQLSTAELNVLSELVRGKQPSEIAAETSKRVSTVRTQLHRAYTKCGVSNMAELTALLLRQARNKS